jgi:hypothetical protein
MARRDGKGEDDKFLIRDLTQKPEHTFKLSPFTLRRFKN